VKAAETGTALVNLRACVILLVIGFHSVLAYLGSNPAEPSPFDAEPYAWLSTPIIDKDRWFGFDLFCAFQYVFLMPFMFLLSGLFVWPSLQRKGSRRFVQDRALRLGLPFVLGVYLLMPLAHFPVYRATMADPSWSAFWAHWIALKLSPSGPLWFLWMLLALDIVAAVLHRLVPDSGESLDRWSRSAGSVPLRYFVGLTVLSLLVYVPLASVFKPWQWSQFGPFGFQPGRILHYLVYFLAGVGMGARGLDRSLFRADGALADRWLPWVGAALAAFVLWLLTTALSLRHDGGSLFEVPAEFAFVLSSATACFGFAAIFLRFGTRPNRFLDRLSANAYGMYLIHYVFVTWLQYLLLRLAAPGLAKGAIVFAGVVALSWFTTGVLCRIPIGARVIQAQRHALRTPSS
jgi:glucans biosynthesis protein C